MAQKCWYLSQGSSTAVGSRDSEHSSSISEGSTGSSRYRRGWWGGGHRWWWTTPLTNLRERGRNCITAVCSRNGAEDIDGHFCYFRSFLLLIFGIAPNSKPHIFEPLFRATIRSVSGSLTMFFLLVSYGKQWVWFLCQNLQRCLRQHRQRRSKPRCPTTSPQWSPGLPLYKHTQFKLNSGKVNSKAFFKQSKYLLVLQ